MDGYQTLSLASSSSSNAETLVASILRYNNMTAQATAATAATASAREVAEKEALIARIFKHYSPNNSRFRSHDDAMDWLSNDFGLYVCFQDHCLFQMQADGDFDGVQLFHQIDAFTSIPATTRNFTHDKNLKELIRATPLCLLTRLQDKLTPA